jgi:hypothetical protein
MFAGDFASDMVANGGLARASAAERRERNAVEVANSNAKAANDRSEHSAGNCGVRFALAAQLANLDPKNPLLEDKELAKRIEEVAIAAFKEGGNSFAPAREAGKNFPIPGRETRPRLQPPTLLKDDLEPMKLAYAGAVAQRNAFAEQLRKLDPDNPLLNDIQLLERLKRNAQLAYKIGGDNFVAARNVGSSFSVPGRE